MKVALRWVRLKEPVLLRHPENGLLACPDPTGRHRSDDPLVMEYPWAFEADNETQPEVVEKATNNPGQAR